MSRERRLQSLRLERSILEPVLGFSETDIAISGIHEIVSKTNGRGPDEWVMPPSGVELFPEPAAQPAGDNPPPTLPSH